MNSYLDRREIEQLYRPDEWQRILFNDFSTTMLSEERPFPCIFGVAGLRANQLRFLFLDPVDHKVLAAALVAYLAEARSFGSNTSLVVMTRPGPVHSISFYRLKFWGILQDLAAHDSVAWPEEISERLDTPSWEFCFAGEPIFVVCNTPAHALRQSRRSTSFMMTFQPRWVFENILGSPEAAEIAFKKVRSRLAAYDFIEASPALGKYGDPSTREFAQYFLDEHNRPSVCPFHSLNGKEEKVA